VALIDALGDEAVRQMAAKGEGEAQYSQGFLLVSRADGDRGTPLGASGRSPMADVGLALSTCISRVAHRTEARRCGHLKTCFCGCQPQTEEGTALLEKAAGQGHAYAMDTLSSIHSVRKDYEHAAQWATKSAETGLPSAMFNLGVLLEKGEVRAAPDYSAAVDWYTRAADAGVWAAANNLSNMYEVGRGWARQIMPATSSSTS